jgi:histidinol dehydrogenase
MQLIEGFEDARAALCAANRKRAFGAMPEIEERVRAICDAVRTEGDAALERLEKQFDCPTFEISQIKVSAGEIEDAYQNLSTQVREALERAARNIEEFHRHQPVGDWMMNSRDGVFLGQRSTAIERAGLYAPNAKAALPSSVLMVGIPAKVAGVEQIVLATPPSRDGSVHPLLLAAARIAGIEEIYKLGGAVAMAAFAYGTASVPKVDKIVGPANIYGTLAKKYLYGVVGVDGLYGPSEVVILSDDTGRRGVQENSNPHAAQLAADLIAQAEHGPDSFVCFVATSRLLCAAVLSEIESQIEASPRCEILRESLAHSLMLCVDSLDEAIELVNEAAAEHVEIWSRDALSLSTRIRHAGAIFLNTPVPLGDYIAGPSHTLPTGATARFSHGVGVETFLKRTSVIAASRESIASLADDLETIALLEDLPGHAGAVRRAAMPAPDENTGDWDAAGTS